MEDTTTSDRAKKNKKSRRISAGFFAVFEGYILCNLLIAPSIREWYYWSQKEKGLLKNAYFFCEISDYMTTL